MLQRWSPGVTWQTEPCGSIHASANAIIGAGPSPLSPRQTAVLQLICRGLSNKHIARSLDITPETVKSHASRILERLNARSRAEAVAIATRSNLV